MSSFKKFKGNNGDQKSRVCFAFQKGQCERGNDCRFSHSADGVETDQPRSEEPRKTNIRMPMSTDFGRESSMDVSTNANNNQGLSREYCKRFQRGQCKFGESCRFLHEIDSTGQSSNIPSAGTGIRNNKDTADLMNIVPNKSNALPKLPDQPKGQGRSFMGAEPKGPNRMRMTTDLQSNASGGPKSAGAEAVNENDGKSHLTSNKFSDLNISTITKSSIANAFKYQFMSQVQSQVSM